MKFRLQALSAHLLASIVTLSLILGALYFGWYRWPGWYLADAKRVAAVLAGVDVVIGPLLTFVIAAPGKQRRELIRDIGVIVALQLAALGYGSLSLWNGRPLYYAFSETVLQMVQAYDISAEQAEIGRRQNAALAPYWYSVPRWIWAPLPSAAAERDKIVSSAVAGGTDVIGMPRYFKDWQAGLPALQAQLKALDNVAYFTPQQKAVLRLKLQAAGFKPDEPVAIALIGRGPPLLAVFDHDIRLAATFAVK